MKKFLKILVYFVAIIIMAIIKVLTERAGITLGAIPATILFAIFIGAASFIAKKIN